MSIFQGKLGLLRINEKNVFCEKYDNDKDDQYLYDVGNLSNILI